MILEFRNTHKPTLDMEAIRSVAGNEELTEDQVFDFGEFVILRSGLNANHSDIVAEAQRHAVGDWIGKPILGKDHDTTTVENQIGRIYSAWIETTPSETVTKGRAFGILTDDKKDLFARIKNKIHKEMSAGIDLQNVACSVCGSDIDFKTNSCGKHQIGVDCHWIINEFTPHHLSFVGDPAIEGAGLLARQDVTDERLDRYMDSQAQCLQLQEDGKTFRKWTSAQFVKSYRKNDPTISEDQAKALAEKLSAEEMISLARIEERRFHEALPDGRQQTQATTIDPDQGDSRYEFLSLNQLYGRNQTNGSM